MSLSRCFVHEMGRQTEFFEGKKFSNRKQRRGNFPAPFFPDVRSIDDRLVINSCHYRFTPPFSLFYTFYIPLTPRYNASNNRCHRSFLRVPSLRLRYRPTRIERGRGIMSHSRLTLPVTPTFFTRIDRFHPLTHNLLFPKSRSSMDRQLVWTF